MGAWYPGVQIGVVAVMVEVMSPFIGKWEWDEYNKDSEGRLEGR